MSEEELLQEPIDVALPMTPPSHGHTHAVVGDDRKAILTGDLDACRLLLDRMAFEHNDPFLARWDAPSGRWRRVRD